MDNAILIGLSRQSAMMRQMSVIANNLANMNTNGYKSESMIFDEFLMPVASEESPDKNLSFVQDLGQFRNVADGDMQTTGNPLDVAISGEGIFKIQTPQGMRYTRDGHFQLDGSGQLVTTKATRCFPTPARPSPSMPTKARSPSPATVRSRPRAPAPPIPNRCAVSSASSPSPISRT